LFGSHKRRLAREGVQARGVVTDRHVYYGQRGGLLDDYDVTVRVSFDDGTTNEFTTKSVRDAILGWDWRSDYADLVHGRTYGYGDSAIQFHVGDVIPVRYDSSDHSRVMLDTEELKARFLQQYEADKARSEADTAALIARGEARAAGNENDQEPSSAAWDVGGAGDAVRAEIHVETDPAKIEAMKEKLRQMAAQNPTSVVRFSSAGGAEVTSDPVERLEKLADLHERGALTDAEFAAEKAKILGEA
jgi:hypothetical protein